MNDGFYVKAVSVKRELKKRFLTINATQSASLSAQPGIQKVCKGSRVKSSERSRDWIPGCAEDDGQINARPELP